MIGGVEGGGDGGWRGAVLDVQQPLLSAQAVQLFGAEQLAGRGGLAAGYAGLPYGLVAGRGVRGALGRGAGLDGRLAGSGGGGGDGMLALDGLLADLVVDPLERARGRAGTERTARMATGLGHHDGARVGEQRRLVLLPFLVDLVVGGGRLRDVALQSLDWKWVSVAKLKQVSWLGKDRKLTVLLGQGIVDVAPGNAGEGHVLADVAVVLRQLFLQQIRKLFADEPLPELINDLGVFEEVRRVGDNGLENARRRNGTHDVHDGVEW